MPWREKKKGNNIWMMSFFLSLVFDISENLFPSVGQNIATFTIFYIIKKQKEDEKKCRSQIIYVRGNLKKVSTISWVVVNNLRDLIQLKFFLGLFVSLFIFCVFCIITCSARNYMLVNRVPGHLMTPYMYM